MNDNVETAPGCPECGFPIKRQMIFRAGGLGVHGVCLDCGWVGPRSVVDTVLPEPALIDRTSDDYALFNAGARVGFWAGMGAMLTGAALSYLLYQFGRYLALLLIEHYRI